MSLPPPLLNTVMVAARAPLTVRCGDVVVHVPAPELLRDVLSACRAVVHSACSRVAGGHARHGFHHHHGSCGQGIAWMPATLIARGDLPQQGRSDADRKYLTQVNSAYSLLRHDSGVDIRKRVSRIADSLSNQQPPPSVAHGAVDLATAALSTGTPEAEPKHNVDDMFEFLAGMASSNHTPVVRAGGIDRRRPARWIA